jgi:hypothetical protein
MKKIIILLSLISLSFTTLQEDYCEGWELGYCQGWEDVKGEFSFCPIVPMCPMSEIFQTEYLDGYNRGFKKGRVDANNE